MSCEKCGKPLPAGARFCASCGTPVAEAGAAAAPTDFHIVGDVMQAVVVPLAAGQEVQAEAGAMLYMAGDVDMDTSMKGGLWAACAGWSWARACS